MPRLSIIIVTYNSARHIDACLRSLVSQPPKTDHEIIVVDNGSTDGTAAAIRAQWKAVRVIDAGDNLGFAGGNNLGIRQSFGSLVLLLNPDTSATAGAVDSLVGAIDRRPDVAIVGPKLVDANRHAELSWGKMVSPLAELRQKRAARNAESLTRDEREVDWVSGACLLVRRDAAEDVGLMDERYFMYLEDVDAAFDRAVRAGATVSMPLMDAFWGDRYGQVQDPFGHKWSLATHTRAVSEAEIEKAGQTFAQTHQS